MILAKNLYFRYPGATSDAIADLNLHLPKGHFGLLTSPGGSGKSTFIKLLLAVHPPTSGSLSVVDEDMSKLKDLPNFRRSIGVLSEDIGLIADRTVAENIRLPLDLSGVSRSEKVHRLTQSLHRFGLDAVKNELPAALSDGMRRKAMLARALINEPLLLIADEPAMSLDPSTAASIWDLLFREHQRGMSILATVSAFLTEPRFACCTRLSLS